MVCHRCNPTMFNIKHLLSFFEVDLLVNQLKFYMSLNITTYLKVMGS